MSELLQILKSELETLKSQLSKLEGQWEDSKTGGYSGMMAPHCHQMRQVRDRIENVKAAISAETFVSPEFCRCCGAGNYGCYYLGSR